MNTHSAFILAAYGLTFLVIAGLIGTIVTEHVSLRKALAKFPSRGGGASGDEP